MPMFDYVCGGCAHRFELLMRSRDVAQCGACGSLDVEKLLSVPALKTSSTRGLAMQAAKRRDNVQATDIAVEQRKYEASHDD